MVDISYVMNEIRGRYVMLATYTCYPGYKLLNQSANKLYCRNMRWGAAQPPKCIPGQAIGWLSSLVNKLATYTETSLSVILVGDDGDRDHQKGEKEGKDDEKKKKEEEKKKNNNNNK